jgi:hypothetical protein
MHIILIIFGVLLLLFGGGCTLIVLWMMLSEPGRIGDTLVVVVPYWIPLGLLPLGIGWLLFRWGVKTRRAKQDQK